ncbi:hypothetical protein RFI_11990 [Reticulomyxa filosa]|uniref:Uncharacterized protein n=1 Tax=Reticulomyxa filosa TaxID=46433 RepID=X6NGX1_RETFI|nr:hypothetical protein RFI_11990 [Reticulomyxa filosa]|eukprot:ETO25153.1 hypothetical protein RFI_11990 [Reticulomyxa filosa]
MFLFTLWNRRRKDGVQTDSKTEEPILGVSSFAEFVRLFVLCVVGCTQKIANAIAHIIQQLVHRYVVEYMDPESVSDLGGEFDELYPIPPIDLPERLKYISADATDEQEEERQGQKEEETAAEEEKKEERHNGQMQYKNQAPTADIVATNTPQPPLLLRIMCFLFRVLHGREAHLPVPFPKKKKKKKNVLCV